MKTVRTLLVMFLVLPGLHAFSQCSGDYTWVANGATISFVSTTSPGVTNIWWDFGDGNYDYTNNPSPNHTYSSAGTYTACITVYDSASSCTDSTCHQVMIDTCYGSFTYSTAGLNGNFYGYANGSSPNTVYQWNFGDNTSASTQNATHTYANAGTYTVCFAYYDLVNGCSDSVCMPVTFGGCSADFTWLDSLGYVFFFGNSTLGSSGNYYWDFGDNGTANTQYPSHTYAAPGIYQVCLIVYDSLQNFCDSTCHMVTISNVSGIHENVAAMDVSVSPNPSDHSTQFSFVMTQPGKAEISVYDITGRTMTKTISNEFSSGRQSVSLNTIDFAPGIYSVQLFVNGQTINTRLFITHQ